MAAKPRRRTREELQVIADLHGWDVGALEDLDRRTNGRVRARLKR